MRNPHGTDRELRTRCASRMRSDIACYVMACHVMQRYVTACDGMLRHAAACCVMLWHVIVSLFQCVLDKCGSPRSVARDKVGDVWYSNHRSNAARASASSAEVTSLQRRRHLVSRGSGVSTVKMAVVSAAKMAIGFLWKRREHSEDGRRFPVEAASASKTAVVFTEERLRCFPSKRPVCAVGSALAA